jgi:hypothetical protein
MANAAKDGELWHNNIQTLQLCTGNLKPLGLDHPAQTTDAETTDAALTPMLANIKSCANVIADPLLGVAKQV